MKYITPAPETSYEVMDLPPFMKGRYSDTKPVFDTRYILMLVNWAELEYNDTIAYLIAKGKKNALHALLSVKAYVAQAHIVASTEQFSKLVRHMDDKTWWSYPDGIRKFLSLCYKIYESEKN